MKAKFCSVILSALLLAAFPAKAQFADNRDFRNNDAGLVINNYYDDNDYYYSSRINRFHKSYASFDYYSPVFTETYWYSYQPYSWGVSIYGRSGRGFGFATNYPVYYYGWGTDYWYDHNYGWYDPYYGSSWYWGYDPYYYSWYSPVVVNINVGYNWRSNHYWNWYGHNHLYHNQRPVYHTTNNYFNNNYYSDSYRPVSDRNKPGQYYRNPPSVKRESIPAAGSGRQPGGKNGNFGDKSNERKVNSVPSNSRPTAPVRTQPATTANPSGRSSTPAARTSTGTYTPRKETTVSQSRSSSSGSATRSSGSSTKSRSSSSSKSSSGSASKSDEKRSSRSGR